MLTGERMGVRDLIGAALIVSASLLSGKIYNDKHA
jgi:drug/metabolite transporter (DMT)-like permease